MISALILAAGASKRMGQPKMLLPWGSLTVIEQVVSTFLRAEIEDILVVTGGAHEQVEQAIERFPVRRLYNRDYEAGEMLSSLQLGLSHMTQQTQAVLVGLGDQPQLQEGSVRLVYSAYQESRSRLVVPSFQKRRGHPWLVARSLWNELLALSAPASPRDFLNNHADEIHYVNMDTQTILADLDTPEDYTNSRP